MTQPSRTILIAHLDVKEDFLEEYLTEIKAHAHNSVQIEADCLRFEILTPQDSTAHLILFEVYTNDAALELHSNSEHMAAYRKHTQGMVIKSTIYRCNAEYP
jgi:autoinducer 2-degrading protein